jgi:uncharacterized protein
MIAAESAHDAVVAESLLDSSRVRIVSLDVLRGVGVLGMLAVHIQLFAFPSLARWNPTAYGDFSGINWWVWLASAIVADGKFITIFAMLFGVSIVMLSARDVAAGCPPWRTHVRRMAALLVLGLAHAYLLWYGDMLVPLALCGAIAFFAWRLPAGGLVVLGTAALVIASALSWWLTWSTMHTDPAGLAAWRAQWTPRPELTALEVLQYRGSWVEQMAHRVPTAWETHTWYFPTHLFWKIGGLIVLGMALFKLGILSAARSRRFYAVQASIGLAVGTALVSLGLWHSAATDWDLLAFSLIGQQLHYWGDILVALGMVAVIMLLCQRGLTPRPLVAVGRTALTNYLLQTIICTTIFYGHGFGLFGRVDRAGQLAIVFAIWAFELAASSLWVRYFALGPVEWVWRGVVFGRLPVLRRPIPVMGGLLPGKAVMRERGKG